MILFVIFDTQTIFKHYVQFFSYQMNINCMEELSIQAFTILFRFVAYFHEGRPLLHVHVHVLHVVLYNLYYNHNQINSCGTAPDNVVFTSYSLLLFSLSIQTINSLIPE